MPNGARRHCIHCGRHDSEVGAISWQGNCAECGDNRLVENIVGIHTKTGVAHRRHVIGMARSLFRDPGIIQALDKAGCFPSVDASVASE